MSEEPRTACTKIAPQLLGIVALAALFIAFIRSDHAPESPFQQAARRLRIGMTSTEAEAAMNIGGCTDIGSTGTIIHKIYGDLGRGDVLSLVFHRNRYGTRVLTEWSLETPHTDR